MREELARGRKEREVFLRAQQLLLKQSAKELLDVETRNLSHLKTSLLHEEER